MKYQPSLPEHNDNISDEHPLKEFLTILAGLSVAVLLAYWMLGLLVDVLVERMSPAVEARLTQAIAAPLPDSPASLAPYEARLQEIVDGLAACAGLASAPTVRVTASAAPNAVVVPGGSIIVFGGLLDKVRSENGLAFVLAHELAHTVHRDHLRAMGRALVLFTVTALVTGDGSQLAGVLGPAQRLGESRYSRSREAAADAAALRILHCRYGHAGGATELFESLRQEDESVLDASHYFASHPSMSARIAALRKLIAQSGWRVGPVAPLRLH